MRSPEHARGLRRLLRLRPTIRVRLTLLFGGLFLALSVALVAIASLPVSATSTRPVDHRLASNTVLQAAAQTLVSQQRAADLAELRTWSVVALATMAAASAVIGWLVAGRVLRPMRTMTAEVQAISAANLQRRLAPKGPDDELKELGDTFDGLLDRLQDSLEAQRQFVANASHELRTPLSRQRTLLQVALSDPDATLESLRATCELVLASGRQEEDLIESLLLLARGERGLERLEGVDLAAIAAEALRTRETEVTARGLNVRTDLSPAPTSGDRRLLIQLVANLMDNAFRYNTPQGEIEIVTAARDRLAVLRVSNSGPVVPPGEVDRLFEPFRRLGPDRTGHGDGWGLGLSIVRAVTVAHQGTVDARARVGGGLDIVVTLPSQGRASAVQGEVPTA